MANNESYIYVINAPHDTVIRFLETQLKVLKATGKVKTESSGLIEAKFEGDRFKATLDEGSLYYTTEVFFSPQYRDGSTRVEILNSSPDDSLDLSHEPFLVWTKLRAELDRSGYNVIRKGSEPDTLMAHNYPDPESIEDPNHRRVVKMLIEREIGPRRITYREIAETTGYKSISRITDIKDIYERIPQVPTEESDLRNDTEDIE